MLNVLQTRMMKFNNMIRSHLAAALASVAVLFTAAATAKESGGNDLTANPEFVTPVIEGYGKIVRLPNAGFQPEKDSKVVLDVTSDKLEGEVIKALDRAALIFNQYADADAPIKMAVVLHGAATKAALSDVAYQKHEKGGKNSNLELIRQLNDKGVEIFVCGQALAHKKYGIAEVAPEVTVAVSAATVNITLQKKGYSFLPFH